MKKENEFIKSGYLLYCDGSQCKQCLDAWICRQRRGLDEKDIKEICENIERKLMRNLPQNLRAILKKMKEQA